MELGWRGVSFGVTEVLPQVENAMIVYYPTANPPIPVPVKKHARYLPMYIMYLPSIPTCSVPTMYF